MVALTALWLYWLGRKRYKCPLCGRIVRWSDEICPHCGDDMKFRHRIGPPPRKSAITLKTYDPGPRSRRDDRH
jgi:predicted amidophosphoribosyltransferase